MENNYCGNLMTQVREHLDFFNGNLLTSIKEIWLTTLKVLAEVQLSFAFKHTNALFCIVKQSKLWLQFVYWYWENNKRVSVFSCGVFFSLLYQISVSENWRQHRKLCWLVVICHNILFFKWFSFILILMKIAKDFFD